VVSHLHSLSHDLPDLSEKDWAWRNFLSARSLVQAENVRNQLLGIMERNDLDLASLSDQRRLYTSIKQALVCGFFAQVAHKSGEKGVYVTVKDHQVRPFTTLRRSRLMTDA
jgi:pre-mRNA-splicing factor ATP-dependent RNA helicase DHX15/PRP43